MGKRVALIHATLNSVQPMIDAFRRYEPSATVINFLDEGLLAAVNEQGGVTPGVLRQFVNLLERAVESGAEGILLTCSVFSPSVPIISPLFSIPVVSVDGAMLEQAVNSGNRIGVVATVATAGPTTARQIEEIARRSGKSVQVEVVICENAFANLQFDPSLHDQLVKEAAMSLANKVDIMVLAQISMARTAACLVDVKVPILTSPESSIRAIMQKLA